jgi:hypothetical protein
MIFSNLFPHSLKYEMRRDIHYLIEFLSRFSIWNWQIKEISIESDSYNSFTYVGRRKKKSMAMLLMGVTHNTKKIDKNKSHLKKRLVVSEVPLPVAICVPNFLSTILPIDRPLDQLLENIGNDKLKFYRKYRDNCSVRKVIDDEELDRLNQTMLRPFSTFRYGEWALHYELSKIKKIARNS